MTERPARASRLTAATAIKAILVVQLGIAAVLFGRDIATTLPGLALAPRAPNLTEPVRPGDQTRRYSPDRRPIRTAPGQQIPTSREMPARLQFGPVADGVAEVWGTIAEGDAVRFSRWLESLVSETKSGADPDAATPTAPADADTPLRLRLDSPGGSVADALEIGRGIRDAGLDTELADGAICLSACPYILAGGAARRVSDAASVGLHQHYFGENIALPAFIAVEDIQRGQGEVLDYLDAMGIDLRMMRHILETPPDEIYILVAAELESYALATELLP